jgi:hypothetical protein
VYRILELPMQPLVQRYGAMIGDGNESGQGVGNFPLCVHGFPVEDFTLSPYSGLSW